MPGARDTGTGLDRVQPCDPVLEALAVQWETQGAVAEISSVQLSLPPFP